jgi:polyisoprenoid-binding protein YceI
MSTISSGSVTQLPTGVWSVDPESSELGFSARGMFGLAAVRGQFGQFDGTLTIDSAGARGELIVQATSLETHNAKRDTHLRSSDFFDVETHPTLTFELTGVKPTAAGGLSVSGVLRIRDNALAVETPVKATTDASGHLTLATTFDVDRAAAGVGWSKMGMIKGKAHLSANLTLTKQR